MRIAAGHAHAEPWGMPPAAPPAPKAQAAPVPSPGSENRNPTSDPTSAYSRSQSGSAKPRTDPCDKAVMAGYKDVVQLKVGLEVVCGIRSAARVAAGLQPTVSRLPPQLRQTQTRRATRTPARLSVMSPGTAVKGTLLEAQGGTLEQRPSTENCLRVPRGCHTSCRDHSASIAIHQVSTTAELDIPLRLLCKSQAETVGRRSHSYAVVVGRWAVCHRFDPWVGARARRPHL
jgi:hypothetical protein